MVQKIVLLVEGKDDEHVIKNIFLHHKIPQSLNIKDKKGIDNLLETLDVELLDSDLQRLAIIVDADIDLTNQWVRIINILKKSGYNSVPDQPDTSGTVITQPEKPVIGVWLMPDNSLPGMLENFVSFLIPQGDNLWDRAKQVVEEIPEANRRFQPQHKIKAQIHTWLAWQKEPGKPLGLAVTFRYLDADAQHAKDFINWINKFLMA